MSRINIGKESKVKMALIKCPECGKEMSDQARFCPSCGFTRETGKTKTKILSRGTMKAVVLAVIIICFIAGGFYAYRGYVAQKEIDAKETTYQRAEKLIVARKYDEAISLLQQIKGYKDADALLMDAQKPTYDHLTTEEKKFYNCLKTALEWEFEEESHYNHYSPQIASEDVEKAYFDDKAVRDTYLSSNWYRAGEGWYLSLAYKSNNLEVQHNYVLGRTNVNARVSSYENGLSDWYLFESELEEGDVNANCNYNIDLINQALQEEDFFGIRP